MSEREVREGDHHRRRSSRVHGCAVRRPRQPRAARHRGVRLGRPAHDHERRRELPGLSRGRPGPGDDGATSARRRSASAPSSSRTTSRASTSPTQPLRVSVGDEEYLAETVIVATGANARQLGLESRAAAAGPRRVLLRGLRRRLLPRASEVVVVGGGDSAMEEAIFLTKFATKVTVVHRRDEFRASQIMLDRARANAKIEFLTPYVVDGGARRGRQAHRRPRAARRDRRDARPAGGRPLRRDRPRSEHEALPGSARHRRGRLPAHQAGLDRDERRGVFAAGDVVDHMYRQAVTAAGMGCMAALDAERWLARAGGPPETALTAPRPEAAEV